MEENAIQRNRKVQDRHIIYPVVAIAWFNVLHNFIWHL